MSNLDFHPLDIGNLVAYWLDGQPREGIIRYFSGNRKTIFIRDNTDQQIRPISANLVSSNIPQAQCA